MTAIFAILAGMFLAFSLFLIAVLKTTNKALHCERNDHEVTRRALRKALIELGGSVVENYNRVHDK